MPKRSTDPIAEPDLSFETEAALDFDEFTGLTCFEPRSPKKRPPQPAQRTLRSGPRRRRTYDLSRVPRAAALLRPLPAAGHAIHALMSGDFHAWDLIPAILEECGPAQLHIATLGFNLSNNGHLCDLLDAGAVTRAWLLCSSFFAKTDPDTYAAARSRLIERGQRIAHARSHAKVILIRGSRAHYVIESSANLRSCNNLEQLCLIHDRALYQFHRTWIEGVIDEAQEQAAE